MGREEWISVLKLSTLWAFGALRQKALDQLSRIEMGPIDKVMLARDYRVEAWLIEGYSGLIYRRDSLSSEERKKLGYETTIRLYEQREEAWRRTRGHWGECRPMADGSSDSEIRETFAEELIEVRYGDGAIQEASGPDGTAMLSEMSSVNLRCQDCGEEMIEDEDTCNWCGARM
jgi:hypothetical protein